MRRVEACEDYVLFIHNNRKKVQKRRVSFRTNPIQSWLCSGPVRYVRKGDKEGREGTGAEGRNTRLASEETHQTHNTRCDYPPLVCHCLVGTVVRTFAFCFAFVSRSLYCKHPMVAHPALRLSCWGGGEGVECKTLVLQRAAAKAPQSRQHHRFLGERILVFCFVLLFCTVLGCCYFATERSQSSRKRWHRLVCRKVFAHFEFRQLVPAVGVGF